MVNKARDLEKIKATKLLTKTLTIKKLLTDMYKVDVKLVPVYTLIDEICADLLSDINPETIDIPYTLPSLYTFSKQSETERKRITAYLDLLISIEVPCRLILGDGHVSENVIVQSFDGEDVKSFYGDISGSYQVPIEFIKEITPINSILPR